jgi:hypothetical protein
MWIPDSTEQIIRLAKNGELHETASFDAKDPDALESTKEIAKDIAAMSTEGGVLLYGVGEDDNGEPTVLSPFELQGMREKIANVVQTCIQPPPQVRIKPFRLDENPSRGFLSVEVPRSPEAPHMVIKSNDNRFYGRNGPRNAKLDAGQVGRLYQQREQVRENRSRLLDKFVDQATIKPHEEQDGFIYLRIAVDAPYSSRGLLESVLSQQDARKTNSLLAKLIERVEESISFPWGDKRGFNARPSWKQNMDGYVGQLGLTPEGRNEPVHGRQYDVWLGYDGGMYFNTGALGKMVEDSRHFFEGNAANFTVRFLHLAGLVYEAAEYFGPVDIAVKVSGLKDAVSTFRRDFTSMSMDSGLSKDKQTNSTQSHVRDLVVNPKEVAHLLLKRLINTSTSGRAEEVFDVDESQ